MEGGMWGYDDDMETPSCTVVHYLKLRGGSYFGKLKFMALKYLINTSVGG